MSAEARIVGYSTGQPETLSLNPDYTLPAGMSHSVSTEWGEAGKIRGVGLCIKQRM